ISFANIVNGTGSLVLTDDLEIYNRLDMGMPSEGCEWLQIGRGYQSDVPDVHGGRRGKNSTSEGYIRNRLDAWLGLMTTGRAAAARAASCPYAETAQDQGKASGPDTASGLGAAPSRDASPRRGARSQSLRALSATRGAAARRGQVRRLAGAVHA